MSVRVIPGACWSVLAVVMASIIVLPTSGIGVADSQIVGNDLFLWNTWLTEAIAHAGRQELMHYLGWLFISESQDFTVKETSSLVEHNDRVTKRSADVHCALGRESANLTTLDELAKVICDESGARYNEMERLNHLGTVCVGVGCAE